MIQFDSGKYDFNQIIERILHYYPIGISKEEEGYFSCPGIQELDKILVDNISNESNYKSRWTDFSNYLTVSPVNEYAEVFKLVAAKIQSRFIGYRFVPFGICRQKIEGLYVRYSERKTQTVFNALFKDNAVLTSPIMGDWTFGYDDWVKADLTGVETEVVLLPPDY
ncbi:MAG: hypothetical protein WBJ10_12770 [Daejeonella sp.]|uniref:hypothetical protein n=1 Tax=Daejeonella sp. TaxID=2805397 RepID=UPI003C74F802